jgi:hypothetical protein
MWNSTSRLVRIATVVSRLGHRVVQRVPVKIRFGERPDVYIGPGMSVVPTVKVR